MSSTNKRDGRSAAPGPARRVRTATPIAEHEVVAERSDEPLLKPDASVSVAEHPRQGAGETSQHPFFAHHATYHHLFAHHVGTGHSVTFAKRLSSLQGGNCLLQASINAQKQNLMRAVSSSDLSIGGEIIDGKVDSKAMITPARSDANISSRSQSEGGKQAESSKDKRASVARSTISLLNVTVLEPEVETYCVRHFHDVIQASTQLAEIPVGASAPFCCCYELCALRKLDELLVSADGVDYNSIWVCAQARCMYWASAEIILGPESVVVDAQAGGGNQNEAQVYGKQSQPRVDAVPDERVSDEWKVWNEVSDEWKAWDESQVSDERKGSLADQQQRFDSLARQALDAPPGHELRELYERFWADLDQKASPVDNETAAILLGDSISLVSNCDCGNRCGFMICCITGDLFEGCAERKCFYIRLSKQIRKIAAMDVGQYIGFGQSHIDRYTTLHYIMRWFGYSFTRKLFKSFQNRPANDDFPKGSYEMRADAQDDGKETSAEKLYYDGFISYRGATHRISMHASMCKIFNMVPAVLFLYGLGPILVGLISLIPDPCDWSEKSYSYIDWLTYEDACSDVFAADRSWFIFRAYDGPIIILIVLFWHPLCSCFYGGKRYFLDKYCVHQSDLQSRTIAGVLRLPLFLKHSKVLYSLFDADYAKRLWCVFEIAIYLRLRKNPKIKFISVNRSLIEIAMLVVSLLTALVVEVEQNVTLARKPFFVASSYAGEPGSDEWRSYLIARWIEWSGGVLLSIILYTFGDFHFTALRQLRTQIANFDARQAQLADASDRLFLLRVVHDLFSADVDRSDVDRSDVGEEEEIHVQEANEIVDAQSVSSPASLALSDTLSTIVCKAYADEENSSDANIDETLDWKGIDIFNKYVRRTVPLHIPTSGLRSWKLFSYLTAMILFGYETVTLAFDSWSWPPSIVFDTVPHGVQACIALLWEMFFVWPFEAFVMGAEVKLLVSLHEWSRLPRWTSYALFLPLFIFIENVLGLRSQFFYYVFKFCTQMIIAGRGDLMQEKYQLIYWPFFGLRNILPQYWDPDAVEELIYLSNHFVSYFCTAPQWVQGFGPWTFYQSWYVLLILWLFVIIPIIICVLYVYESSTVRKYRQIYWKRFVAYVRKRFIRAQTSDVGEASPDVPHVEATAGSGKSSIASKTSSSYKV